MITTPTPARAAQPAAARFGLLAPVCQADNHTSEYFRVLHRLSTSHKFVQIGIKGKQVVFRGRGLGAKNTINDVKAMFRAEGQRPDKFLLIVIRDPLVM